MNLKALKILGRKVEIRLRKWRYSPAKFLADEVCKQHRHITKLGTPYGGWSYVQDDSLRRSWVVLCGAGTDVEFAVNLLQVCLHGVVADAKSLTDVGIGEAIGDAMNHVDFTRADTEVM